MSDLPVRWEISETSRQQLPPPPSITGDRHRSGVVSLVGTLVAKESKDTTEDRGNAAGPSPWVAKRSENPKQQHDSGTAVGEFAGSNNNGDGDRIDGNDHGGVNSRAREVNAKRGPFSIFPGSVVVPSGDEVSFDVAFSPTSLGCTE